MATLIYFRQCSKAMFYFYIFYVLYSTLLYLPPLGFHCVEGSWDRRTNYSARSHPHSARYHQHSARCHPHSARSHPHSPIDLIHTCLDFIHTRLDLIHIRLVILQKDYWYKDISVEHKEKNQSISLYPWVPWGSCCKN